MKLSVEKATIRSASTAEEVLNLDNSASQTETLPEYLKMYEIAGQGEIAAKSYQRYQADKKAFQALLEKSAEPINSFVGQLEMATGEAKLELIRQGFASGDFEMFNAVAYKLGEVPDEQRPELIKLGLATNNSEVQILCADMIGSVLPAYMSELISHGLQVKNADVHFICSRMIDFAPEEEQPALYEAAEDVFASALSSSDVAAQKKSAELVGSFSDDKKVAFVKKGLATNNPEVQKAFAWVIPNLSVVERPALRLLVADIVKNGMASSDLETIGACVGMIGALPADMRFEYIKAGLLVNDIDVQKEAARLIQSVLDMGEAEELLKLAQEKLGNHLVEPLLYKNKNINGNNFSRQSFEKTGSGTTLLGGELKNNTIIRHITPRAFLAWQEIYENHQLWKDAGFDYVPLEPIQSFRLNKQGGVDVFAGVLDLDFNDWQGISDKFITELERDKAIIIETLKDIDFKHGHAHDRNFCLRFFRNSDGSVDLERKPRLYLIDFDQAVSPGYKTEQ